MSFSDVYRHFVSKKNISLKKIGYCVLMKRLPKSIHYALYIALNIFFWIGVYFFYTFFLGYGSSNVAYVSNFSAFLIYLSIFLIYFIILFLICTIYTVWCLYAHHLFFGNYSIGAVWPGVFFLFKRIF